MKQKYLFGINFLEQERFEEAYKYFDDLVQKDPKDLKAIYLRANIDFFHLRKNLKTTYEDMKYVVKVKPKAGRKGLFALLCVLAEEFDDYENCALYGQWAIFNNNEFCDTLYPILGRAYYILGTQKQEESDYYYNKSLESFLKALELFPDEKIDVYKGLVDVYYRLGKYEDCLDYTQKLMSLGVNDGILYFYRGVCNYQLAKETEDYETAIYNFDKALNYNPEDYESKYFKALALYYLGEKETSDKMILEVYNIEKNPYVLGNILHFYATIEAYDKIINFPDLENILQNVPNKFFYARVLDFFGNKDEIARGLVYYKELFKETKERDVLDLIVGRYKIDNKCEELVNYLDELLTSEEEYPRQILKLYKMEAYRLLGYDYSKIRDIMLELIREGYYKEEYLYNELYMSPQRSEKDLYKLFKSKYYKDLDLRLKISILLYGDIASKVDHKFVNKMINNLRVQSYHPCSISLLGRIEELLNKDYEKALKIYRDGYDIIYDHYNDYCNCSAALYAHALYNGYDSSISLEEARKRAYEIILREIKKKNYCNSSNIHYLYAYFALNNVEGFSIEEAIKMLKVSRCDSIYDLDCIYLLMKCYEDIDINESSKYLGLLYQTMPQANKLQKEYYSTQMGKIKMKEKEDGFMNETELDDDVVIYPFLNNR